MNQNSRIQKIIGQLEGLQRMTDDESVECSKILQQVKAIEGAVASLRKNIIDQSLENCLNSSDAQKEAKKVINSIRRYM